MLRYGADVMNVNGSQWYIVQQCLCHEGLSYAKRSTNC